MKNKKSIILTLVAVATLVALVVGATYAYFQATGGAGSSSNIKVETATTDLLTFNFSKSIAIYADQSNFGQGAGSKSDSTKGIATLTASNSPSITSTTDRYNIYFIIDSNDFVYTTSDNKTELLLKVTDPNGNEVTAIDGLLYKDGGFDITTRTGGFLLVPDYDITANRGETTKQEWNITVTIVNLDTNQSANMGKTFSSKLYMTKDQMSSYELSQIKNMNVTTTYNSIETTLNITSGSAEIEKYYFGKEKISSADATPLSIKPLAASDVTFIETTNPNYKFTNLEANSTYKIYSYAVDKNGIKTNMYETEIKTEEYVLPVINGISKTTTLNTISVLVNASKGSNNIYKYHYSCDNGETYIESTEPSYTFENLADSAEYKIKIKVEDTDGKFSTVYSESINTVTYILPTVTTATTTTKYNQITVATTATDGTTSVSKYYYSINNGAYVEDGASHTFTGLNEQTTYTIKVKVVDTNGRESVVYETSAKTDAYKLPTVTIASTSSTTDSITINLTGTNGDGTIKEYYYSKDNGSSYVSSTSSSYTFTGLTDGATFYIKAYVKDSNGRTSSVVSGSVATEEERIILANSNNSKDKQEWGQNILAGYTQYCTAEISEDNGQTWKSISFPTEDSGTISLKKGNMIRTFSSYSSSWAGCGINICDSNTCESYHSTNNCSSNSAYSINGTSSNYTIQGNETYYTLSFCYCLVGDTYVYIEDKNKKKRKKKIKDLKVGDKVYVIDEQGRMCLNTISKIHKNKVTTTFKIMLENDEVIECSQKHYFIENTLGAMAVEELKVGYELYAMDGKTYKIKNIQVVNYPEGVEVYNLSFNDDKLKVFAICGTMILTFGVVLGVEETTKAEVLETNSEVKTTDKALAYSVQFLSAN